MSSLTIRSRRIKPHKFSKIIRPHDIGSIAIIGRANHALGQRNGGVAQIVAVDAAQGVEALHDFIDTILRQWLPVGAIIVHQA